MAVDLVLLALSFLALLVGFGRGAVKVTRGFFTFGVALSAFAMLLPGFLRLLFGAPYFLRHAPERGGLTLCVLLLLLLALMALSHLVGRLAARGLDLFLAEALYRFAGAFLSLFNLWLSLNALQLALLRLFPPWAFDPRGSFQELVFAASRAFAER
ncbi:MAG: hypothetical protein J0L75_14345 [Spirochaetes bacterium]|nr:hypothetical protein [Spirochaetota bacterium]